ncbi:hypothetical protein Ae201684P_009142 [Aphanomyces euteiches]|nr:hypothetical protein Ae201684P_009142 [Aphanomyces euteiches]
MVPPAARSRRPPLSGVSRSTFPGSDTQELQILTANINGLKDNGHKLAEGLLNITNVVALQETKIAHRFQHDTFRFHLDHALGVGNYFLATNDQRHTQDSSEQHRSSGVMMLFHKETPGFARLVHNKALDIFNKYMVVHTWWEDTPVFFHNVYAPVQNQEREAFFDALPRDFPRELDAMDPFLMSSFSKYPKWSKPLSLRRNNFFQCSVRPTILELSGLDGKSEPKSFFQEYHVEHLLAKTRVSDLAKRELLRAQAAFDAGRLPPQALEQAQAKYDEMMSEWKSYQNDINFDFHATKNETSTAHFFRPQRKFCTTCPSWKFKTLTAQSRHVLKSSMMCFMQKWSAVMCENDFQAPKPCQSTPILTAIAKRLTDEQRDSLDSPITTYELAQAIKTWLHTSLPEWMDSLRPFTSWRRIYLPRYFAWSSSINFHVASAWHSTTFCRVLALQRW